MNHQCVTCSSPLFATLVNAPCGVCHNVGANKMAQPCQKCTRRPDSPQWLYICLGCILYNPEGTRTYLQTLHVEYTELVKCLDETPKFKVITNMIQFLMQELGYFQLQVYIPSVSVTPKTSETSKPPVPFFMETEPQTSHTSLLSLPELDADTFFAECLKCNEPYTFE